MHVVPDGLIAQAFEARKNTPSSAEVILAELRKLGWSPKTQDSLVEVQYALLTHKGVERRELDPRGQYKIVLFRPRTVHLGMGPDVP